MTDISTHEFSLDSGHPGLDLANTLDGRHSPRLEESLPDYQALVRFAAALEFLDPDAAAQLIADAEQRPHEAAAVHASALALREATFEVAAALAGGAQPGAANLAVIARAAAEAHAAADFIYHGEGFGWSWERSTRRLERPLWPLASATMDLLTNRDLSRLRMCAADDCAWLFLDETRNRSRKWCDMSTCGNRAKVARYRSRGRHGDA